MSRHHEPRAVPPPLLSAKARKKSGSGFPEPLEIMEKGIARVLALGSLLLFDRERLVTTL